MSNEPDKIIYSMIRVSKRHGQREVLMKSPYKKNGPIAGRSASTTESE